MTVKLIVSAILVFFVFTGCSHACGPDFDEAYLVRAKKEKMYVIPSGDFIYSLKSMLGKDAAFIDHDSAKAMESSIYADAKLLEEALKAKLVSKEEQKRAVESYLGARRQLADYVVKNYPEDRSLWYGSQFRARERIKEEAPFARWSKLDKNVPVEFSLYLDGARSYYRGNFAEAQKQWTNLLALPKEERLNKSVWAAFMIGKSSLNAQKESSIKNFELTRSLAKEGYKDPLDLAGDSYGWQALAELELKRYAESIEHYLQAKDAASLELVCNKVSEEKAETIKKLVKDATARKVLLAWTVSRAVYYSFSDDWAPSDELKKFLSHYLSALESLKNVPVSEADRIAWIYYNMGDFKNARRWVELTKYTTPLSKLIDARLLLRAGDIDGALSKLHDVVPSFEQSPDKGMFYYEDIVSDANSQIGVLKMARKDYLSALETLLRGKYWEDIAYVAEKVLTTDELARFIDEHVNDPSLKIPVDFHSWYYISSKNWVKRDPSSLEYYGDELKAEGKRTTGEALAFLLARRYARSGDWEKALKYYPKKESVARAVITTVSYDTVYENIDPGQKMKELRDQLIQANNNANDARLRAKAYYEAGIIMRKYGMEIMGTELEPDSYVTKGQFSEYGSMEQRFALLNDNLSNDPKDGFAGTKKRRSKLRNERDFFSGSEEEEKLALASYPDPNKRWHYRYKAADLMWKASKLLPDNDGLKAKALCYGGRFMKVIDQQRANKFYKELIKTCGNTALGKEAHKIHWFPKMED